MAALPWLEIDAVLAPFLNDGGIRSSGNFDGGGVPNEACSHKCIAKTNSSHPNLPSESISERALIKSLIY